MGEIDADLVERARGGDREAFAVLVGMHLGRAQAVARAVLGDDAGADDAVQEAFIAAWTRLGSLADPAAFPSWLSAIVRNRARDVLRRQAARRESALPAQVAAGGADDGGDPALAAALAALDADAREILRLRYEAGLDARQCAETLGISPAAAEKRLWRAREALRRRLG